MVYDVGGCAIIARLDATVDMWSGIVDRVRWCELEVRIDVRSDRRR